MSVQSVPELSEMSKLILKAIRELPRDKKKSFASYKSRAKKRLHSEDAAIKEAGAKMHVVDSITVAERESVVVNQLTTLTVNKIAVSDQVTTLGNHPTTYYLKMTTGDVVASSGGYFGYHLGQVGTETFASCKVGEDHADNKEQNPRSNVIPFPTLLTHFSGERVSDAVTRDEISKDGDIAVVTDNTLDGSGFDKGTEAGQPQPVEDSSDCRDDSADRSKIRYYAKVVFAYRYIMFKFICYLVLVPASALSVTAFVSSLGIYRSDSVVKAVAFVLTAAVDLLFLDVVTRGIKELRAGSNWKKWTGQLLAASVILALNVGLSFLNFRNNAKVDALSTLAAEQGTELRNLRQDVKHAQEKFASAQSNFLVKKWSGSADPFACEEGRVICKGPFLSSNKDEQREMLPAKPLVDNAKAALTVPSIGPSSVIDLSSSRGNLTLQMAFYLAIWSLIILATFVGPKEITSVSRPL